MLLSAAPAYADETVARAHFKKGIDLYDAKKYQDALIEFDAAYREKPSAGIKQNIALCLKGLNRPAEAATSFDEALDEGKDTLKPETRAAIDRELADLSKIVATVQVTIAGADDKRVAETVITVQPIGQASRTLAPGAQRKPIRLMPGMYMLGAKIPGQNPQPEPKRLALISGPPTEVTFGEGMAQAQSTLNVHVNVAEAHIKIDGVEVGIGKWTGPVMANRKLRVEVNAEGYRALAFDMTVPANSTVDSPITLQPVGAAPSEYRPPLAPPPEKPRGRIYLGLSASGEGSSYRLSNAFGPTAPEGLRQGYGGASLGGRFGFLVTRHLALEFFVELGGGGGTFKPAGGDEIASTVFHWMLMPMVRFQTPGKVRFAAGTGIGVHGLALENKLASTVTTTNDVGVTTAQPNSTKASGIAAAWLLDAGVQFDMGPIWLEAMLFLNVHGVGPVEENVTSRRALLDSPGIRSGLRLGLGIPF